MKNTGCPRCDELGPNVYCSICLSKKYGDVEKRKKVQATLRRRVSRLKRPNWDGTLIMGLVCPKGHQWDTIADFTAKGDPFRSPQCPECGRFWSRYLRAVLGEESNTACTEKCWKAKELVCKCSCIGAKHGILRDAA